MISWTVAPFVTVAGFVPTTVPGFAASNCWLVTAVAPAAFTAAAAAAPLSPARAPPATGVGVVLFPPVVGGTTFGGLT